MTESQHPLKTTATSILYAPNTGLAPSALFPFVTSPKNFSAILRTLPPVPASQAQLMQSLIDLLHKSENNGPLILQANSCDDPLTQSSDPLCHLISLALSYGAKDRKPFKTALTLIKSLVKRCPPHRHHMESIHKILSCHSEPSGRILAALKIVHNLSTAPEETELTPVHNYFFFSPFAAGLSFTDPSSASWEFSKAEDMSAVERSGQNQPAGLFRLEASSGRGFECGVSGQKLFYRVLQKTVNQDEAKGVEIGTLPLNQWACVAVSHSHNKSLTVSINSETKQFSVEYPKISDGGLEELGVCKNFAGQMTSFVLYKAALPKEQLAEISIKLPFGVCDQASYKNVLTLPQQDIYLAISAINETKGTAYNLCGEKLTTILTGNSGAAHLLCSGHIFSLHDLLPLLPTCAKLEDPRVLAKTLKTMLSVAQYVNKHLCGTVSSSQEFKLLGDMLRLNVPQYPSDMLTVETMGVFEEISAVNKELCSHIVKMLFETRTHWLATDISVQTKYWEFLTANSAVFSGIEDDTIGSTLATMFEMSSKCGDLACCTVIEDSRKKNRNFAISVGTNTQSLNVKYQGTVKFVSALIQAAPETSVVGTVVELLTLPETTHCLFAALLGVLEGLSSAEMGRGVSPAFPNAIAASGRFPGETQTECVRVLTKFVVAPGELSGIYTQLYKIAASSVASASVQQSGREGSRKMSQPIHEGSKALSGENPEAELENSEEPDTNLLQEKVLSEEANINSTIKKIKQIKIDIQETNKAKTQREAKRPESKFPVLNTDFEASEQPEPTRNTQEQHILSIEELVAQDPYKPPPAPKNEKMKLKKFVFGGEEETEEVKIPEKAKVLPAEKPKIETKQRPKKPAMLMFTGEENEEAEDPLPKMPRAMGPSFAAKLMKGLAINTEEINKEFDIGGEKGKKLVDEAKEEQREEQEIMELAEHCVLAMSRSSPSELVVSRYSSRLKGPLAAGLSVPITSTHKSTLMQAHKGPALFPQSTKERKQFNFNLEGLDAIASTPIKEESLMTSKSSVAAHENPELSPESDSVFAALFAYMLGKQIEPNNSWRGNELSMILLEYSEGEIVNPAAISIILRLARRCVAAGLTINPVLSTLIKICESNAENKCAICKDGTTMRAILRLEQELYVALHNDSNKAKNIVEYEQIIAFHATLVSEAILDSGAMCALEKSIVGWIAQETQEKEIDPGVIGDCFKYMWGKALTEVKQSLGQNEVASNPAYKGSTGILAEITALLLFQTSTDSAKGGVVSFSAIGARSAPVVPFSDAEILRLLFDTLAPLFWRSSDLQDLFGEPVLSADLESYITSNKENICVLHLSPLTQQENTIKIAPRNAGCVPCLSLLMALALKNAVGVSELEYWTQEAEVFTEYLLLALEASRSSKSPAADSVLEDSLLLLFGCLLQGCCEQSSPDEHRQLCSQTLAHIFQFLFSLMCSSESKTRRFYETRLGGKDGKCIVPIEEIRLVEGIGMAELMRVLSPEYGPLLENNSGIAEQLGRLSKDFAQSVQADILSFCETLHAESQKPTTATAADTPGQLLIKSWEQERIASDKNAKSKDLLTFLRLEKKWNRISAQSNQDYSSETAVVPSSHLFENGLRCLLKHRNPCANRLAQVQPHTELPSAELCATLYASMEERFRKKLPPPASAELLYRFQRIQGTAVVYKPKSHQASLLFVGKNAENAWVLKKWRLDELKGIHRMQTDRLEMAFYGGKAALLRFESAEVRDLVAKRLVRLREKWCKWLKYDGTLDPIKCLQKSRATEMWLSWKTPTLDYLLALNRYCGRSLNDPTLYPLLPYEPSILAEVVERVIGTEKMRGRESEFLGNFKARDSTKICPHCAVPHGSSEVVPEVYALPEALLSSQQHDDDLLCKKHRDEQDKPLPDDPYKYVIQLNEALEKNSVAPSSIVNNWIDRTFGVAMSESSSSASSCKRLFKTAHPAKSAEHVPTLWDPTTRPKLTVFPDTECPNRITHIHKATLDENVAGFMVYSVDGSVQCAKLVKGGDIALTSCTHYENNCNYSQWTRLDGSLDLPPFPLALLHKHKFQYTVQGGYLSGAIQLSPLSQSAANKPTITLNYHASTVTCIAVDREERLAVTGTKQGDCMVFSVGEDMFWRPRTALIQHSSQVTSISVSDEMNLFVTASLDGTANLYGLAERPKLLRTFRPRVEGRAIPISAALLAYSPLPCVVIYSRMAVTMQVFSINGELLSESEETAATILGMTIVHDSSFCNYVAYWRDNVFVTRRLPYLEERIIAECENVTAFVVGEGQDHVILATGDGKLAALSDGGKQSQQHN